MANNAGYGFVGIARAPTPTAAEGMAAYDALPGTLRALVANASVSVHAPNLLAITRRRGTSFALALLTKTDNDVRAAMRAEQEALAAKGRP